ncbi:MAG: glutathione S-transferase [Acidobacteria bacterium]|nr:glutathione S-transferase [Acidobacteriota bacterium]
MYTLVIGTQNWSSWSLRPYVALRAAGVPFETVVIRLREKQHPTTRDQILPWSPAGKVPVLKIAEDGKTITVWDSLAICETIAERHPEAGLLPADTSARAIMRSYACEMHSGFPDVRDQLGMEFARKLPLPELRDDTRAQVARIITSWEEALATYGGDFLFGKLSVADCMYAPVVSRFVTYGVAVPPAVQGYMDRVMALASMQDWMHASREEITAGLGNYKD